MDFVFRRSYCGPVRAVILDWAGTAVDYGSFAPTAVFLGLFQRHGVEITPEDARSGMGLMKKDHLRTILRQPRVASAWQAVHRKPPTEADIENLFADFVPLQITILKNYAKPIPGLWFQADERDPLAYVKLFTIYGWHWLVLGLDPESLRAYCYVIEPSAKADDGEFGLVDLAQLAKLTFCGGALGVERDLFFSPGRLSELIKNGGAE